MINGINGVNNNAAVYPAQSAGAASQVNNNAVHKPDLDKAESIRAEQRQWIEGQQRVMRQVGSQVVGLTLANMQPDNNIQAGSINNLYNLGSIAGIRGIEGMQDYFSMFVRDDNGGFSVDFSGVAPEVAAELVSRAREDVSENGFWGVSRTSERIFGFAEALSGGDPAKMATMQRVVERAFESIGEMFGGVDKMPDISRQTLEAVRQRFDEFAAAAQANMQAEGLEGMNI